MFRRSASSLLLAGLLFADGSWLGRLEQLFRGFLGGGSQPQAVWAASDCGGTIDPNGKPSTLSEGQDLQSCFAGDLRTKSDPHG